ncbi:hypothetical protein MMC28_010275 [Mycoblastus sanguinarius]|nr:hypothetical protein [Mycoblastus sanguinarius]
MESLPRTPQLAGFMFVDQFENIPASRTRSGVRSHAMSEVRRQKRQKRAGSTGLTWLNQPSSHNNNRPNNLSTGQHGREPLRAKEALIRGMSSEAMGPVVHLNRRNASNYVPQPSQAPHLQDNMQNIVRYTNDRAEKVFQTSCESNNDDPIHSKRTEDQDTKDAKHYGDFYEIPRRDLMHSFKRADDNQRSTITSTSPRSILGAGRINPFERFPVQADHSLYELVDHCM